ncbi:MAG: radical SAM protein, partial [Desulfuromonadaceae bacterium]|nr:radical SAM protein [Desulfuromonadaceae bacterium]
MRVYAVSMDRNLVAIGFRRVVSSARAAGFDITSIYFLDDDLEASFAGSWWRQKTGDNFSVNYVENEAAISALADKLADGDVLAISLMSVQRNIARKLCLRLRQIKPSIKIIVGGYHPTLFPDDALSFADVICLGEGERTFVEFLQRVRRGDGFRGLPNTWVINEGEVLKNHRIPLLTPAEMESMPFMEYGIEGQFIFSYRHGRLRQMTRDDLMRHLGTTYNTIWSVGCPHTCKFCSQAAFIGLDRDYALYRGPSPEYIIREIAEVQANYPLDYVIFYDSNFLGRSLAELTEFAKLFKKTGLGLILSGTNPASITEEKLAVLLEGGLVRIKMGFESASEDILRLFNRPVNVAQLSRATDILGCFGGKMVAPAFEMIVDNPYETLEQLYKTVDFLEKTPPPFTISLFSLQFMPGTALSSETTDFSLVEEHMDKEYMFSYRPTLINNLISLFAVFKPPAMLGTLLRRGIKGREEALYPGLKTLLFRLM